MNSQGEKSNEDVLPGFPAHVSRDSDANKSTCDKVDSSGMHAIFEERFYLGVEERCEVYRTRGNKVVPGEALACFLEENNP